MIEQLLKGIVKEIERRSEKKVRVGRVSKEVADELKRACDEHRASHLAIKDKIEAYIEKLEEEHDCTPFNERKMEAWEKIYNELGLAQADRTKRYSISHEDRVIYLIEDNEEDNEDEDDIEIIEVGIKVH